MLLRELWRVLSGQVRDDQLVNIKESEDLAQIEDLHLDRDGISK